MTCLENTVVRKTLLFKESQHVVAGWYNLVGKSDDGVQQGDNWGQDFILVMLHIQVADTEMQILCTVHNKCLPLIDHRVNVLNDTHKPKYSVYDL